MKIYDISRDILSAPLYPGTVPPVLKQLCGIGEESGYRLSEITADLHTGTHADAPSHCIPDGETVDKLDLNRFIGDAVVYDLLPNDISGLPPAESAKILLLKNSAAKPLTVDDCTRIIGQGYITVGVDTLTVGGGEDEYPAHYKLLSSGIGIIENICLDEVDEGSYFISALPVKIAGAEASFCRAVLVEF